MDVNYMVVAEGGDGSSVTVGVDPPSVPIQIAIARENARQPADMM